MFYDKFKKLRNERNLTQSDVAEKLNVTPEAYTQYEKGKRRPNLENFKKLALIFNVSTDYLFELSEYRTMDDYLSAIHYYFSDEEKSLIDLYRQLPEKMKSEVNGIIKGMLRASGIQPTYNSQYQYVAEGTDITTNSIIKDPPANYIPIFKIRMIVDETNVKGPAAAGKPAETNEYDAGRLMVGDRYSRFNVYAIQVKGDSMKNAAIENNDFVIIKPQPAVDDGNIALVDIGGSAAIRHFYKKNNHIELRPANPEYQNLVYEKSHNVRVIGKVIDTIKRSEAQIV